MKLIEKKETAICIEDFPAIVNDTSFKRIGYKEAGGLFSTTPCLLISFGRMMDILALYNCFALNDRRNRLIL